MKTSKTAIQFIKDSEGFKSKAYLCPAGKWTIGYGFTNGVRAGQTITRAEADARLIKELPEYEGYVIRYVKPKLTQGQFDALVSWVFNLGSDRLHGSTLLKRVNINPNSDAVIKTSEMTHAHCKAYFGKLKVASANVIHYEFMKWVYEGKNILPGLVIRRAGEWKLYSGK